MSELFQKARKANLPEMAMGKVEVLSNGVGALSDECPHCGPDVKFTMFTRANLWRYKCTSCKAQGDVIDYVSVASGVPSRAAALKIIELQPSVNEIEIDNIDRQSQMEALHEVGKRLFYLGHTSVKEVLNWADKIGINEQDATNLALDGRLRMLPANMVDANHRLHDWVGTDLLIKSGLQKKGNKCPAIAFRQIVMFSKDRKAIEFMSIDEATPSLMYGQLSSPIILAENPFSPEVMLVNSGIDGLKAIGSGFHGTVWDAPNGNWKNPWFWDWNAEHPGSVFNLSRLPDAMAAEIAATLQSKGIAFH